MDEDFRNQVYNSLNLRETDELIEIWQKHDPAEWTELALDVVREILLGRLGELPTEDDMGEVDETESDGDDEFSEVEAALPDENPADAPEKVLPCPNCKGNHTIMRAVEVRNSLQEVVLRKPERKLELSLGIDECDQIVGVACEDCGFVFFMLKDFV